MPRVKLIYVGYGEFIPPKNKIQTCDHPRDWRRWYPDSFPYRQYCCLCGLGNINPLYGYTQEEIEEIHKEGEKLALELGMEN